MSSPAEGGRRRSARLTVAVTGAADVIGAAVAVRLAEHGSVRKAIALDTRRLDTPGVVFRQADARDPGLAERLGDVDVVIHADIDTSPDSDVKTRTAWNVRGAQTVLTAAAAAGVNRVVLFTSAVVYGAYPDNPVPLAEDAPLRAVPDGSLVSDYLEIERLAERAPKAHPGLSVTVLRPAVLTGPGVDTVFTRHFEAPRLLVVKDSEPCWQFCHVDDLADAIVLAAAGRVPGVATVACEGWLEQGQVEALTGLRRVELPAPLAFAAAQRLQRFGVVAATASDLAYLVHPWVVPSTRLRSAGWRAKHDNDTAVKELLAAAGDEDSWHVGARDATLASAGAAVAVVGTAALVRAARRRRRG